MNEKHIEGVLDHKTLKMPTIKYLWDHRKHRYELVDEPKKQPNRIFIRQKLVSKVIVDCQQEQHINLV